MKRINVIFALILMMIYANARAQQVTATIDGLRYLLNDNNAQVARQDKSLSGDIIIPETVMYEGKSI